jgi:hypothetical protein
MVRPDQRNIMFQRSSGRSCLPLGADKLLITAVASVLLLHLQTVTWMPDFVATTDIGPGEMTGLGVQPLADTSCSSATVLSVYKPQGLTRYRQARTQRQSKVRPSAGQRCRLRILQPPADCRQVSNDRPF